MSRAASLQEVITTWNLVDHFTFKQFMLTKNTEKVRSVILVDVHHGDIGLKPFNILHRLLAKWENNGLPLFYF